MARIVTYSTLNYSKCTDSLFDIAIIMVLLEQHYTKYTIQRTAIISPLPFSFPRLLIFGTLVPEERE